MIAALALGAVSCSMEIWSSRPDWAFSDHLGEGDDVTTEESDDSDSEEAADRGWSIWTLRYDWIRPPMSTVKRATFDAQAPVCLGIDCPPAGELRAGNHDWEFQGGTDPYVTYNLDDNKSLASIQWSVCEEVVWKLTVTATDGTVGSRTGMLPGNQDVCDSLCDGRLSQCPADGSGDPDGDGDGELPPDCQQILDQLSGGGSGSQCIDNCVYDLGQCLVAADCQPSTTCQNNYISCVSSCS